MPLGRKHLRRSRDAPTDGNWPLKNYFYSRREVTGSQIKESTSQVRSQVPGKAFLPGFAFPNSCFSRSFPLCLTPVLLRSVDGDCGRHGFGGIGHRGCGNGHAAAGRNRRRGLVGGWHIAGYRIRRKCSALLGGETGEFYAGTPRIIGDDSSDAGRRADLKGRGRRKSCAERDHNRRRLIFWIAAGGERGKCNDNEKDRGRREQGLNPQTDFRLAKGHRMIRCTMQAAKLESSMEKARPNLWPGLSAGSRVRRRQSLNIVNIIVSSDVFISLDVFIRPSNLRMTPVIRSAFVNKLSNSCHFLSRSTRLTRYHATV